MHYITLIIIIYMGILYIIIIACQCHLPNTYALHYALHFFLIDVEQIWQLYKFIIFFEDTFLLSNRSYRIMKSRINYFNFRYILLCHILGLHIPPDEC